MSFAPVRLTADSQSQLRPWAEAIHRCALVYSAQAGLELVTRVSFRVGESVIHGYVDCEVFDDASAVVSGGTLLGPLSYLDSACARHANVRWSGGHSGWVGRALRALRVGETSARNDLRFLPEQPEQPEQRDNNSAENGRISRITCSDQRI